MTARVSSCFLGFRRQNLLGHAVAIDRSREATIDGDLPQDGAEFLGCQTVPQSTAEMRFEFVHTAEASNHAKIEQAAVARLEVLVGPHRTPAKFVEQILKFAIEIIGIGDCPVDIFVTQHLAAHRHALVVECFVHEILPFFDGLFRRLALYGLFRRLAYVDRVSLISSIREGPADKARLPLPSRRGINERTGCFTKWIKAVNFKRGGNAMKLLS